MLLNEGLLGFCFGFLALLLGFHFIFLGCIERKHEHILLNLIGIRDVTTHPHSKESRPEIWKSSGIARDTQVGDDPLFPKLPPFQNDLTLNFKKLEVSTSSGTLGLIKNTYRVFLV